MLCLWFKAIYIDSADSFWYRFHYCITAVVRKRPLLISRKCMWQDTTKGAYNLDPTKSEWADAFWTGSLRTEEPAHLQLAHHRLSSLSYRGLLREWRKSAGGEWIVEHPLIIFAGEEKPLKRVLLLFQVEWCAVLDNLINLHFYVLNLIIYVHRYQFYFMQIHSSRNLCILIMWFLVCWLMYCKALQVIDLLCLLLTSEKKFDSWLNNK